MEKVKATSVKTPKARTLSLRKGIPAAALSPNTREKLIQAAKTLFAERGYDGTSVKEISKAARVNISLISYHFKGKEGLYCACLQAFGEARLERAQRILTAPTSLEEFRIRLHLFVEEILVAHLDNPEASRIVMRECDLQMPIAREIFQGTFFRVYETLVEFFNFGKNQGWIRNELDIQAVMSIFLGGVIHSVQKDWASELFYGRTLKDQKYREALISNSVSLCLDGCMSLASKSLVRSPK